MCGNCYNYRASSLNSCSVTPKLIAVAIMRMQTLLCTLLFLRLSGKIGLKLHVLVDMYISHVALTTALWVHM